MSQTPPAGTTFDIQRDIWGRWLWMWSAIFYISLLVSTVIALTNDPSPPGRVVPLLGLVILSGLWHWFGAIYWPARHPNFRQYPWPIIIYIAGAILLWYILVNLNSSFYFLLFGLYGQCYLLLPILLAISGSLSLTILLIYLQIRDSGGESQQVEIVITVLVGLGGIILSLWINAIIQQSRQRRELLEQLAETQAELLAAERAAGVLAERQRLAQDIHDTLAQAFTSVVMHLEAAENGLPAGATPTQHHLNQARNIARDSLAEVRRLVWALQPQKLERATLAEVIRRVVSEWSEGASIPAGITITGTPILLHPAVEVTLLRATQEGLANIAKHAQAKQVTVTLSYMNDLVMLDVQDDGLGFDSAGLSPPSLTGGFGLKAMRERIHQLDGTLEIESSPGEGTTLVVTLPI